MQRSATFACALLTIMTAVLLTAANSVGRTAEPDNIPNVLLQGLSQPKETYLARQLKPIRAHGTNGVQID